MFKSNDIDNKFLMKTVMIKQLIIITVGICSLSHTSVIVYHILYLLGLSLGILIVHFL